MSRWSTPFESHPFHAAWETLLKNIAQIKINEIIDDSALIELARLNKAIEYIDKYLKLIDPDINITSLVNNLNNLHQYINGTSAELTNYISNRNVVYLQRANSNIDNCLNTIKVFHTVLPKVSGQGIYSMLKKYNEVLENALAEINLPSTINASEEIINLHHKLIDGHDDEESIQTEIENMYQDSLKKHNELVEYYNATLNEASFDNTTKEIIEIAKKQVINDTKEANEKLLEVSTKIDDLEKFYVKIFGSLDEEGKRVGGLKNELESRISTLDTFDKNQQKIFIETLEEHIKELSAFEVKFKKDTEQSLSERLNKINEYETQQQKHNKNLFNQIESLLPHATSAGLSKAYEIERGKFKWPVRIWNIVFIISLIGMFITSYTSLEQVSRIEDIGNHILQTLPIIAPLIWLAIFASTRRSENQRLEQEYAHKEVLAKSYSSYKEQIDGLKEEDQALLIKLLDNAIDTISKNASETLDKKHGDGMPIHNLTKTLIEEVKKLKD